MSSETVPATEAIEAVEAMAADVPRAAVEDPLLTVGGLFAEIWGGIEALAAPGLVAQKLTMSDFDTLLRLARSPDRRLRMSDLAAQIGVSTSGVTRITDRLERSGRVRREACPGDRRGSFVVITEAGTAEIAQAAVGMAEVVREHVLPAVGDDLQPLLGILTRLRDGVRPRATAGAARG